MKLRNVQGECNDEIQKRFSSQKESQQLKQIEVDQQNQANTSRQTHIKSLFSPYFPKYQKEFIRNRRLPCYLKYSQNLKHYDIICNRRLYHKLTPKTEIIYRSKNLRVLYFHVYISHFIVKVKVLNLTASDKYSFPFLHQIMSGNFGVVHAVNELQKQSAIKEILLGKNPLQSIRDAVKQYAFMKLMAALECGPALNRVFGFDIIVTDSAIYVQAQRCQSLTEYIGIENNIKEFSHKFQQLEVSLMLMHDLYICHYDIKINNIMFSPTLKKFVFIDFGLSEGIPTKIGYLNRSKAKGTFFYCYDDMKKLFFSSTKKDLIDAYYNDYYCLMKTKQILLTMMQQIFFFSDKQERNDRFLNFQSNGISKNNVQQLFLQKHEFQTPQYQKCSYQKLSAKQSQSQHSKQFFFRKSNKRSDYLNIFVCFHLFEGKILQLEKFINNHSEIYNKIDRDLDKIYWVFLEGECSFKLLHTYELFKQLLLKNVCLSLSSRLIFQNILDPYFQDALKDKEEKNESLLNYERQQTNNVKNIQRRYIVAQQKDVSSQNQQNRLFPQQKPNKRLLTYKFKCIKLSLQTKQQVILTFLQISQQTLGEMINIMMTQISYFKHNYMSFDEDIKVFQKIFQMAHMKIDHHDYLARKISLDAYFFLILDFFLDYFMQYLRKFNFLEIFPILEEVFNQNDAQVFEISQSQFKLIKPKIDLDKIQSSQKSDKQKDYFIAVQNFKQILEIFIKLYNMYMSQYNLFTGKEKISNFIETLKQKIIEIFLLDKKICENPLSIDLFEILMTLVERIFVLLFMLGLNRIIDAQVQGDFKTMAFYYKLIFCIDSYKGMLPNSLKQIKMIVLKVSILSLSQQICYLLIQRVILLSKFRQKSLIPKKIQNLLKIIQSQKFSLYEQQVKTLKTHLFRIHYNELVMERSFQKALQKIDELFYQQLLIVFRTLPSLFKDVNNDQLFKDLDKKSKILKLDNPHTFEIEQQHKNMQNDEQTYQKQNDLSSFRMLRKVINQSIKSYPNLDISLKSYVETYLNNFDQIETFYNQNFELFYQLQLPQYFQLLMKSKEESKNQESTLENQQQSIKTGLFCDLKQKQFCQQIISQVKLQHASKLMILLLKNMNQIKDQTIIRSTFSELKTRIYEDLLGKQLESLTYLEIVSRMKQFQCILISKDLSATRKDFLVAEQAFKQSLVDYLTEWTQKNDFFIYETKTSSFGIDALLKIYDGSIHIQSIKMDMIKQKLVHILHIFIENDQVYKFFTKDSIMYQFLQVLVDIGLSELKGISLMKNQNFLSLKDLSIQQSHQEEGLFHLLCCQLGKFAQAYPCSNYTKVFIVISEHIKRKLTQSINLQQNLILNENFSMIVFLNCQSLSKFIKIHQISCLALISLRILNYIAEFLAIKYEKQKALKFKHQNKNLELMRRTCLKFSTDLFRVSFNNLQCNAKKYCIEIFFENLLKLHQTFPYDRKTIFYEISYFRTYRNATQISDSFQDDSIYLTIEKRRCISKLELGEKLYQSYFKRIISFLYKKFALAKQSIFLLKIKQKLVQRVIVSL